MGVRQPPQSGPHRQAGRAQKAGQKDIPVAEAHAQSVQLRAVGLGQIRHHIGELFTGHNAQPLDELKGQAPRRAFEPCLSQPYQRR